MSGWKPSCRLSSGLSSNEYVERQNIVNEPIDLTKVDLEKTVFTFAGRIFEGRVLARLLIAEQGKLREQELLQDGMVAMGCDGRRPMPRLG